MIEVRRNTFVHSFFIENSDSSNPHQADRVLMANGSILELIMCHQHLFHDQESELTSQRCPLRFVFETEVKKSQFAQPAVPGTIGFALN
jgi:hypothetical protein